MESRLPHNGQMGPETKLAVRRGQLRLAGLPFAHFHPAHRTAKEKLL
jgi:hypothetical protein